jgi:hypothetical protein
MLVVVWPCTAAAARDAVTFITPETGKDALIAIA